MSSPRTQAQGNRRGQGEDSICRDSPKNQHAGALSPGSNPDRRTHRTLTGRTKVEIRDKLRELHREAATVGRASRHAALTHVRALYEGLATITCREPDTCAAPRLSPITSG